MKLATNQFSRWSVVAPLALLVASAVCNRCTGGGGDESGSAPDNFTVESVTVGSSGAAGWYNGVAVDSRSTVHLVYPVLGDESNEIRVASSGPDGWEATTIHEGDCDHEVDIEVDGEGALHAVFNDGLWGGGAMYYSTNASGSWSKIELDHGVGDSGCGGWNAIAVDGNNHAHVVWDGHNYATNTGGSWSSEDWIDWAWARYDVDIAVDTENVPHISVAADYQLVYGVLSGGSWETSVVDDRENVGNDSSIGVDAEGTVHILHRPSYTTKDGLFYTTNAGGEWASETLLPDGDHNDGAALALDDDGAVHIAYYEYASQSVRYATNRSGSWEHYPVETLGESCGDMSADPEEEEHHGECSIAVAQGGIYIAFYAYNTLCLASFPIGWSF